MMYPHLVLRSCKVLLVAKHCGLVQACAGQVAGGAAWVEGVLTLLPGLIVIPDHQFGGGCSVCWGWPFVHGQPLVWYAIDLHW